MTAEKIDTIILGGGIAGLLAGFRTEGLVITRKVGGQMEKPLGPRYLYDGIHVREFLDVLGVKWSPKKVYWGYVYKGNIFSGIPPTPVRKRYNLKVRGRSSAKCMLAPNPIPILDINWVDFIRRLEKEVEVVIDDIILVDLEDHRVVTLFDEYKYRKLISTLPLPVFLELSGVETNSKIEWRPIYFARRRFLDEQWWRESAELSFLYVVDPIPRYYRVTKLEYPEVIVEYTSPTSDAIAELKYGKIVSGTAPYLGDLDCYFFGRYAEWKPEIKIHHLIYRVVREVNFP